MSNTCINMNNKVILLDYKSSEASFMIEYQNKRMKMWNPYSDIVNHFETHIMTPKLAMLLHAIEFVENNKN